MEITYLRSFTCFVLLVLFGYLIPTLKSVYVVINKDSNGIRDYLTYWCVLYIVGYVEYVLGLMNTFKNHPPEFKVLFILWLTLKRFQGSHRIYQFLVKPYFEKYETDIDKKIAVVTNEVHTRAKRSIQLILWQLFLSPNDGLLNAAASGLGLLSSPRLATTVETATINLSSSALSKRLLGEITKMLREGVFLDVGLNLETCEACCMKFSGEKLLQILAASEDSRDDTNTNKIPVNNNSGAPSLSPVSATDNSKNAEDLTSRESITLFTRPRSMSRTRLRPSSTGHMSNSANNYQGLNVTLPIIFLLEVEVDSEDATVVLLHIDNKVRGTMRYMQSLFPKLATDAARSSSNNNNIPPTPIPSLVVLFSEAEEEAEALHAGLQLLISTTRNKATRLILRCGRVRSKIAVIDAWNIWRKNIVVAENL